MLKLTYFFNDVDNNVIQLYASFYSANFKSIYCLKTISSPPSMSLCGKENTWSHQVVLKNFEIVNS